MSKIDSECRTDEVMDMETLKDNVDSARECSDRVKSQLSVSGTGQMLTAVVWTNDRARRKFEMHPEFGCGDTTMGSNAEKRPLKMSCAKDGEV